MVEEINNEGGLSRRTVVKGAAWSLPVLAVAVAAPAATASVAFDVTVSATCANDYDITTLTTLLQSLNANPAYQALVPGTVVPLVQAALAGIGLTPGAERSFTITATEGTIPAGTQFTMNVPDTLVDATLLEGIIEANVGFIATVNDGTATITVPQMTQGTSVTFDIWDSLIDVGALSSTTLSLVGGDNPSNPGTEGADSATISTLLAPAVDLGGLGIPNIVVIPGVLEVVIDGDLVVQLCDA